MSRRTALRCYVPGCGKPIRKGQAVYCSAYGNYLGRNEKGNIVVDAWLQPGPIHLRCLKTMTPDLLAELLRERRAARKP